VEYAEVSIKMKTFPCLLISSLVSLGLLVTSSAYAVKIKAVFDTEDESESSWSATSEPGFPGRQHGFKGHMKKPYRWVPMHIGEPLPNRAVVGGFQPSPRSVLYVCRAHYNGGVHPGKLYEGQCNIGWGGEEVVLREFEVLKSYEPLHWVRFRHEVPRHVVRAGYGDDDELFICRAKYHGGIHPGKFYKGNCNIGWGGKEVVIPGGFEILTN
jgi:hypothetical protein